MRKTFVIITEGFTDSALVESVLEHCLKYKRYQNTSELSDLLRGMIGKYPGTLGELQRSDSPVFLHNGEKEIDVAVKVAKGIEKIPVAIEGIYESAFVNGRLGELSGFILFTDSDAHTEDEILHMLIKEFEKKEMIFHSERNSLVIENRSFSCPVYRIPAKKQGAVESVLLDCAKVTYPELYGVARRFKDAMFEEQFENVRRKWAKTSEIQKFYGDKVHFGAIATVLKPDRPVGYVVRDELVNRKNIEKMEGVEEFKGIVEFLGNELR